MRIGVYAGSIRPGGGLSVLKLVVEALASEHDVVVYTGARDSSDSLQPVFSAHTNVKEKKFLHSASVTIRYLASKFHFLVEARREKLDWVFSFNYYVPAPCRVAVYHVNLLHFQRAKGADVRERMKDFDAQMACRLASLNIFESEYLANAAAHKVGRAIRNPAQLYVAVDPEFTGAGTAVNTDGGFRERVNIMCVGSTSPYKDTESVLKTLQQLIRKRPEINWALSLAGGQSIEQWKKYVRLADELGLGQKVEFLGPIPKSQLSSLMRQSLCLLNGSYIESFCMVAIEAMASSCPVIVTNAAAMPESVADAGIVVAPGDCEAFAKAVLEFYDKPALRQRYVELGLKRAEQFDFRLFGKRLRTLLMTQSSIDDNKSGA